MNGTVVFHHGALGDSVITWPMLRALTPLTLIAPRGKARLAARLIEGVTSIDGDDPRWARLFAGGEVDAHVCDVLSGATTIITLISSGSDAWAQNVRRLAPDATMIPLPTKPADATDLVSKVHAAILADHGFRFEPNAVPRREHPNGPLVIHPGAGAEAKRWPADRFDRLIEFARSDERDVRVLIGEVERERLPQSVIDGWRERAEVIEPADYDTLADVLMSAWAFVGNDSGPAHLADALGIGTVVLFGPTDARVWRPIGARAITGMHDVEPERVWNVIQTTAGSC